MKCPQCGKSAITIFQWLGKRNAFFYRCNNCGEALRANKLTWTFFILTIVYVIIAIVNHEAIGLSENFAGIELPKKAKVLVIVAFGLPLIMLGYFFGGYVRSKKN